MAFKTPAGDKVTISAGVIILNTTEHVARKAYVVGQHTEKSNIGRALSAGKGAMIGMLAGPVGAIVGAGIGTMLAGGKSTFAVAIETTTGARVIIEVAPEQLSSLEMGLGIKLG